MNGEYRDHWESHFQLVSCHIQRHRKELYPDYKHNLPITLHELASNESSGYLSQIGYTLRHLLTKADKSRIYSRAAAYCIEYLSRNSPHLEDKIYEFIQIRSINRRTRRNRPWHWHRIFRHRLQVDQLLYIAGLYRYRRGLTNFEKLVNVDKKRKEYQFEVCSIFSVNWRNKPDPIFGTSLPYKYMCHLEYFINTLPQAEPYTPLIDMCRTKAFSPWSMLFPALSRQARRAITAYLERVQSELWNQDSQVAWYIIGQPMVNGPNVSIIRS